MNFRGENEEYKVLIYYSIILAHLFYFPTPRRRFAGYINRFYTIYPVCIINPHTALVFLAAPPSISRYVSRSPPAAPAPVRSLMSHSDPNMIKTTNIEHWTQDHGSYCGVTSPKHPLLTFRGYCPVISIETETISSSTYQPI